MNEYLSVKQQKIIKYKAIRKAAKAASSHNIHLFTLEGEKQHGQARVAGQAGGVCWMRWLNDSDDDDEACLKKAANEQNSQFKTGP